MSHFKNKILWVSCGHATCDGVCYHSELYGGLTPTSLRCYHKRSL